jgi:molybdenum cofactor cytidylyltransferase
MEPRLSAILLAAGRSRRMGSCKQLLPLPDRPAVVRCVETIIAARIDDVVVVVGPEGDEVARAVAGLPVAVVRNGAPESDMAGSVRVGLKASDRSAGGVFVCLCDHPLVSAETLTAMRLHWIERRAAIVIPCHGGRKGHPTLFPRRLLAELATLPTLREVIGRHRNKVSFLDVADEGTVLDMDTWEEYQGILGRCRSV